MNKFFLKKITFLIFIFYYLFLPSLKISAGTVKPDSSFNANFLIDDNLFIDTSMMNETEIQAFLERYNSPLAWVNPRRLCGTTIEKCNNTKKASRIIFEAANLKINGKSLGINPIVILVTLEKEQGLITKPLWNDSCPAGNECPVGTLQYALDWAMGYGVPDSGVKNQALKGFYQQLMGSQDGWWGAARNLRENFEKGLGPYVDKYCQAYGDLPKFSSYFGGYCHNFKVTNTTYYYDVPSTQWIKPLNKSTMVLYRYTPHVFNGNYNFWKFLNIFLKESISFAYKQILGRIPYDCFISYYNGLTKNGWNFEAIKREIKKSSEYRTYQITLAYKNLLGRNPDTNGLNYYFNLMKQGWSIEKVKSDIALSDEYRTYQITLAYNQLLYRNPDTSGLNYYFNLMKNNGWSIGRVRDDIMNSLEYDRVFQITLAYKELLGRNPDAGGMLYYKSKMEKEGWTINNVTADIKTSYEYKSYQINLAFREVLNRDPSADEFNNYFNLMQNSGYTPEKIREELQKLDEYKIYQITLAYKEILGRNPDTSGLNYYFNLMKNNGWSIENVKNDLKSSDEYKKYQIRLIYKELLGREADNSGLNYYFGLMKNSGWSFSQVITDIKNSFEYRTLNF